VQGLFQFLDHRGGWHFVAIIETGTNTEILLGLCEACDARSRIVRWFNANAIHVHKPQPDRDEFKSVIRLPGGGGALKRARAAVMVAERDSSRAKELRL
jgi:hypothetical protein